jgi:hypothetical protein
MATLSTETGEKITEAPAADAARVRVVARIEADQQAAAEPAAPPKKVPAVVVPGEAPKRRGRPPKTDKPRVVSRTAAGPLGDEQRIQGVKGLAQIGAGLFLMASKATKKDAYRADAITIASAADDLAQACVETAKADAGFAAALDKVCSAGPYAALISVGVGLASQITRNHRPALKLPGTTDPAEILKAADEQDQETGSGLAAAA